MSNQIQQKQTGQMVKSVSEEVIESLESLQIKCFEIQKLDQGPRKFFQTAEVMNQLVSIFSQPNVLDSFMLMQGSPLGFLTDRDNNGGYSPSVVRDALIQAFLVGIFPVNNQMNIIGGKMYIPKEGFEYLLKHSPHEEIQTLEYFRFDHLEFVEFLPNIKAATIKATLVWKQSGKKEEAFTRLVQVIFHGVEKKNNIDMAFGKAEAKMLQWLYKKLTNITIPQGDATEPEPGNADIPTTAKVEEPATDEQIDKINELLELVHPDVKESMTERLEERDWEITTDEANTIIGPLTVKARKYQESLESASKGPEGDGDSEPGDEVDLFQERTNLEKQMHVLGNHVYGEEWTKNRRRLVKQINPDKTSSKNLDTSELKDIVKILTDLANAEEE